MATTLDRAYILSEEATYGAYASGSARAVEFLDSDTSMNPEPTIVQGQGVRAGALLPDGSRSVLVKQDYPGGLGFEVLPKGQGLLWKWLLGASVSTLVSGATYQQVHTMAAQLASFTVQEQWYTVGGDTSDVFTALVNSYLGCMFTDWELTMGAELAAVKASINGRALDTAQAAVPVVLPSTVTAPLGRGTLSIYSGVLTLATATALASAATPLGGVEQVVVKCNNSLNVERPGQSGLKGKPVPQMRELSVTATVEHRDGTWYAAQAAQTPVSLLTDYSGRTLDAGTERFQVALSDLRVTKITKKVESGMPKLDLELSGKQATTPLQVVIRTSDTAI
jgi:hypothetical protein